MNATVFQPLIPLLAGKFELHFVHLPGYGGSQFTIEFDQQIESLAEELPPAILLGWSMGGLYACALAGAFPQKFSELILVAFNPCFVERDAWSCAVSSQVFNQFSDDLRAGWRATINRFLTLQMLGVDNARTLVRELTSLLFQIGEPQAEVLQAGLELLLHHDARQEIAKLKLPVKLILGERDSLVPVSLATEIVHLNSRIQVKCLAGAAHAPFLSHPQEFVEAITN